MFCISCGKVLDPGAEICSNCGKEQSASPEAPVQETIASAEAPVQVAATPPPAKRSGRPLLFGLIGLLLGAVILFAVFFFSGLIIFGGKSDAARIEGPGYDTPEEAAEAYLEALKNQDIDAMVAVFAVESSAENYDLQEMYELYQAYVPSLEMPFPGSNSYNNEMNIEGRRSAIIDQILWQYKTFNFSSSGLNDGITITLSDQPDLISDMEKDTKDYVFSDLKMTGTMDPEDLVEQYADDRTQEFIDKRAKPYGADGKDIADVVIEFDADGDSWYFCPTLIRYEGRWYIQTLNGTIPSLMGFTVHMGGITREGDI